MTTYYILHYTTADPLGKEIYKTNVFRQTELQNQFKDLCRRLESGESAEYMKVDEKYYYPSMQYVENENGVLYSYTAKGHRRVSKYNKNEKEKTVRSIGHNGLSLAS